MSDLLVVVSKVKHYVKEKSQMNTSASLLSALSERIKGICDQAITKAQADGRKTIMDRDLPGDSSPPTASY